ncbi:hypothetical protein [Halorubrum sp. HHNYT27]|uniref:hypothetical protein n=1 Tax=Halorubrum sp. HHNYT27 TaxID=3402275 RepID=UPI003EBA5041
MHDESPARSTTNEPAPDSGHGPTDGTEPEPTDSQRRPDGRPPATGSVPPRTRDGVDPPNEAVSPPSEDAPRTPSSDGDPDDDSDNDSDGNDPTDDPLAYRLERLRLWRALVTLAVVVARLIRSL